MLQKIIFQINAVLYIAESFFYTTVFNIGNNNECFFMHQMIIL